MSPESPAMKIEREIRFAVVMYGGVSLAIYINGVAQELFQLARATATNSGKAEKLLDENPAGTALVYRQLAQLLSLDPATIQTLEKEITGNPKALEKKLAENPTIHVKFVIDTISGTSAGGINGIFLGKALALNQDIEQLKKMWVEEGNILTLINDKESLCNFEGLPKPDKPKSLLNGQRMYCLLVQALDEMDPKNPPVNPLLSGYVDDLDVFVTTTDVNGLPVSLRLSDKQVTEYRYKNVFHFKYRQEQPVIVHNDFDKNKNPFLAFAARCTSSFPVAFEPMRLETIGELLKALPKDHSQGAQGTEGHWRDYFPLYRQSTDNPAKRPFCDGGYLDNKPFSYAIDMLSKRVPRRPGERKLIYIEPRPEQIKPQSDMPPNAVDNAFRAVTLAQYETIREDLERVLARNRLVERVERLLSDADKDVSAWTRDKKFYEGEGNDKFMHGGIDEMIDFYGPAYGGYHRLKIGDVTDEINEWLAAALDFDIRPECGQGLHSDRLDGLRLLVRAWREKNYSPKKDGSKPTENIFLNEFDLLFRIRRLRFIVQRIDRLQGSLMNPTTAQEKLCEELRITGIWENAKTTQTWLEDVLENIMPSVLGREQDNDIPWSQNSQEKVISVLRNLRKNLGFELGKLVKAHNAMRQPKDKNPLYRYIINSTTWWEQAVDCILHQPTRDQQFEAAKETMETTGSAASFLIFKVIKDYVCRHHTEATQAIKGVFAKQHESSPGWPSLAVQLIKLYYDNYQGYDFVSFPVVYATDVGDEIVTTDVIRISPEDATSLVNPQLGDKRQKLAGTAFHNFGAFFEESWRKNDMLWGRLDSAERLITALLPGCPNLAAALLREAHRKILDEYYEPVITGQALEQLASKLAAGNRVEDPLRDLAAVKAALRNHPDPDHFINFFKRADGYAVDRKLTPESAAEALSRTATVFGKVLQGIGEQSDSQPTKTLGTWLSRFGSIAWGLVEVATPQSLWRLLNNHVRDILLFFAVVMTGGGWIFGFPDAMKLGWALLGATLVVQLAVWAVSDWLTGRGKTISIVKGLAVVLVIGLAILGMRHVSTDFAQVQDSLCQRFGVFCVAKSADPLP